VLEDLIGDLTAVPQPIEIKLFGDDPETLQDAAKRVGGAIGKIKGVVEVVDGLRVAGDAISIVVNPGAAAQRGLDPAAVSSQLEALIGAEGKDRRIVLDLKDMTLTGQDGITFFAQCEAAGIVLANCDPYVREWITRQGTET